MPANRPIIPAESAESQNWTGDTMIFSHVLYQLSYLGLVLHASFSKAPLFYTHCHLIVKHRKTSIQVSAPAGSVP